MNRRNAILDRTAQVLIVLVAVILGQIFISWTMADDFYFNFRRRAAAGGGSAPVVVSWSKGSGNGISLLSVGITNSGANTLQVVHVGKGDTAFGLTVSVTNQAGTAFTRLYTNNAASWARIEMWYLINPPTGANTIYVAQSALDDDTGATVFCVSGAHQSAPFGTPVVAAANGNLTVTVTSAVGELVVGGAASDAESSLTISGDTNPAGTGTINSDTDYAAGYWTGAASVNANWTAGAQDGTGGAVSIKPP